MEVIYILVTKVTNWNLRNKHRFLIYWKAIEVIPLTTQVLLLLGCCHSREDKVSHQVLADDKVQTRNKISQSNISAIKSKQSTNTQFSIYCSFRDRKENLPSHQPDPRQRVEAYALVLPPPKVHRTLLLTQYLHFALHTSFFQANS